MDYAIPSPHVDKVGFINTSKIKVNISALPYLVHSYLRRSPRKEFNES
ncbi:hypothetical protein IQ219_12795 [Synechocystis sp. LEGE 06083]|nr:hypothetical protein [Synechocystis sp. LEGE 06083]MBE9196161.1 hypothetical protein [Synechocystis sp. LEGE 06083]